MPNTPVVVLNGVTIHAAGSSVQQDDRQLLEEMLMSVGIGMEMQEHYMDIMTALSGGGPSFVSQYSSLGAYLSVCMCVRACADVSDDGCTG
jgi:pyrroline-5-carboxylate reductase